MDSAQKQAVLAACPLFADLEATTVMRLATATREMRVAAGYLLLRQGQPVPGLQVMASGTAKLYLSSAAGKELCIAVVGRGNALDLVGALVCGEALLHVITTEPCVVLILPLYSLTQIMGAELCQAIVRRQFARQLRLLLSILEDVALHSLDVRVARLLHRLHLDSRQNAAARLHRLDQTTLSSMANGSRSKVNEQLQALRRLGAIDIQDGTVVMQRLDRLAQAMEPNIAPESVP
ncbi:MAG: Crp/Fnr family transcriptional regulator [Pseudomonas sp.]